MWTHLYADVCVVYMHEHLTLHCVADGGQLCSHAISVFVFVFSDF